MIVKKIFAVVGIVSLAVAFVGAPPEASPTEIDQPPYVPREIIICFRPSVALPPEGLFKASGAGLANDVLVTLHRVARIIQVERLAPALPPPAERAAVLDRLHRRGVPTTLEDIAAIFSQYGQDRTLVIRLAEDVDIPQLAADLMRRYPGLIEFAEPNYRYALSLKPNDPRFPSQWHFVNVKALEAWDVTTGHSDVVIAVIDTGILNHRDLEEKRFINPGEIPDNGIDDDNNRFVDDVSGWDFFNQDSDPDDEIGHGTQVSGVAAAATNNNRDVAGMSWESRLLPLKACCDEDGFFSSSDIIRAINYATMMAIHGVRVINMSFGGQGSSGGQLNAIRAANAANILCVAAAGNDGANNDLTPTYPAGFEILTDNLIGVAATTERDRLASFSNFGLSVGLAAPGESILTTSGGSGTARVSGTSFAAPLVSGIAALIYSVFPDSTPLQVRGRLAGNVDVIDALRGKVLSGGRVNAARVFEVDDVAPAPITDLQVIAGPRGLTLTWTAPGDDGSEGRASFYDIRYLSQPITPTNLRFARKLLTSLQPGAAGTTETLILPEDFPSGRASVLIRALDNVGNRSESNQVEVNK